MFYYDAGGGGERASIRGEKILALGIERFTHRFILLGEWHPYEMKKCGLYLLSIPAFNIDTKTRIWKRSHGPLLGHWPPVWDYWLSWSRNEDLISMLYSCFMVFQVHNFPSTEQAGNKSRQCTDMFAYFYIWKGKKTDIEEIMYCIDETNFSRHC